MKKLCFLAALFYALPALAEPVSVTVPSHEIFEECFDLKSGQDFSYEFDSSAQLDFNVHYHVGEETLYLAQKHKMLADKDELSAPVDQHYCLMWENNEPWPASLQYSSALMQNSTQPDTEPETP